jgi:hypothetical protein
VAISARHQQEALAQEGALPHQGRTGAAAALTVGLSVVAVGVGVGVLAGVTAARRVAIVVAFVTAIGNFLVIPYYPTCSSGQTSGPSGCSSASSS